MTSLRECENNLQPKGKQNHFFLVFELGYRLFISHTKNLFFFFCRVVIENSQARGVEIWIELLNVLLLKIMGCITVVIRIVRNTSEI